MLELSSNKLRVLVSYLTGSCHREGHMTGIGSKPNRDCKVLRTGGRQSGSLDIELHGYYNNSVPVNSAKLSLMLDKFPP